MTDKKEKRPNVLKEWADRMTALLLGRRPAGAARGRFGRLLARMGVFAADPAPLAEDKAPPAAEPSSAE